MNIEELYRLTKWVNQEIKQKKIPAKYQQLHSLLEQNSQPNQQKTPFEKQQEELIQTLRSVNFDRLTKEQISFLDDLRIGDFLGNEGVEYVESILYKNQLDIASASAKIQKIVSDLNEGIRKVDQISEGLNGCVDDDEYELDDEVLIRVCFFGEAQIENVKDFKDWGNAWHEIGRGIAMAHGATPEDIKVVGAAKGSVIIELLTISAIATTVSTIILSALKVAEKVLDIRKKAAEIRHIDLKNKELEKNAKALEKTAEKEKEDGVQNIITVQIKELKLNKDSNGDKISALEKAVTNLVNFVEKGGELDFVIPEEDEEEAEDGETTRREPSPFSKLRSDFENIKKIEHKIKLLEHNADMGEEGHA